MTTKSLPGAFRVLVVDNDPVQRVSLVDILQGWQYEVYAAEAPEGAQDEHQALLEDARHKAHTHRCHLAIVDMRLRDDSAPFDTSGLALVPHLAPTVSIIRSGYGSVKTVQEALMPEDKHRRDVPLRAYGFIEKSDGPEELKQVSDGATKEIWHRREMEILWPHGLTPAMLIKQICPHDESASHDEVEDVLRRLFPDARRLEIEVIDGDNRLLSMPPQQRSVVLRVIEDDHARPVVVKLARVERMAEELKRFAEVNPYFAASRYSQPKHTVELWNLGGAIYEFIGWDDRYTAQLFSEYYATYPVNYIQQALEQLASFWRPLHKKREERASLFRAYCRIWGDRWYEQLLHDRQGSAFTSHLHKLELPDPITWFLKRVQIVDNGQCRDQTPNTTVAVVHGDLHGDNFFVDERHDVWMIDYERTGLGPMLQDFVELEIDILTRLADLKDEPDQFYELLLAILEPITPRSPIGSTAIVMKSAKTRKAFSAIITLREEARKIETDYSQTEYYWGLLFNTIYRIVIWKDSPIAESANRKLQQLYLLAAMVCRRLENWDRVWPPRNWPFSGWQMGKTHADRVDTIDRLQATLKELRYQLESDSSSGYRISAEIEDIKGQLARYGENSSN